MKKDKALSKYYKLITFEDLPFLSIISVALVGLTYLLTENLLFAGSYANTTEKIGISIDVGNIAQRKSDGSLIWQGIKTNDPTYRNDLIRTGEASSVSLTLSDGYSINLDSNSMVLLDFAVDKEQGIKVHYGALYVDAKDQEGNAKTINIESGGQDLSIRGGGVRIESKNEKELNIAVVEGSTVIALAGGTTTKVDKNNEVAVYLQKKEISQQKSQLQLLDNFTPKAEASVYIQEAAKNIVFSGQLTGNYRKLRNLVLEVSVDRSFSADNVKIVPLSVAELGTKNGRYQTTVRLSEDRYYWRLKAMNSAGESVKSLWQRFSVLVKPQLKFYFPSNNSVVKTNQGKEKIDITWEKKQKTNRYFLQISNDSNFRNIYYESKTSYNSIQMELPTGRYYARLSYLIKGQPTEIGQVTNRFDVIYEDKVSNIILYAPGDKEKILRSSSNKNSSYLFNWENLKSSFVSNILIAKDKNFKKVVFTNSVKRGFYYLTQNDLKKLEIGDYYWRIESLDKNKRLIAVSSVRSFRLDDNDKSELSSIPTNETNETLESLLELEYDLLQELYSEHSITLKNGNRIKGVIVRRDQSQIYVIYNKKIVNLKVSNIREIK